MPAPAHWTMKDVSVHLHTILLADHPLTQDQRKALKACIEMIDVWSKLSPGFAKVVQEYRANGVLPPPKDEG